MVIQMKKLCLIIFLFSFISLNTYLSIKTINKLKNIDEITRIHIVANSNSLEDQIIKLKVYENINQYLNMLNLNKVNNSNEALQILKSNKNTILNIANSTLKENNIIYDTKLNIGKIYYDKKESITIDMPALNIFITLAYQLRTSGRS